MADLKQLQWEIAHKAEVQQLINQALAANNTEVVEAALREFNHTHNQVVFHSQAVEQEELNQRVNLA